MHADPDSQPDGNAVANGNRHVHRRLVFWRSNTDPNCVPNNHNHAQLNCRSDVYYSAIGDPTANVVTYDGRLICDSDRNFNTVVHQHPGAYGDRNTVANSYAHAVARSDTDSHSQLHTRG